MGKQQVVLEHNADWTLMRKPVYAGAGQRHAIDDDPPVIEPEQAGDGTKRGGLAGPVGPQHSNNFSVGHLQLDIEYEVSPTYQECGDQTR